MPSHRGSATPALPHDTETAEVFWQMVLGFSVLHPKLPICFLLHIFYRLLKSARFTTHYVCRVSRTPFLIRTIDLGSSCPVLPHFVQPLHWIFGCCRVALNFYWWITCLKWSVLDISGSWCCHELFHLAGKKRNLKGQCLWGIVENQRNANPWGGKGACNSHYMDAHTLWWYLLSISDVSAASLQE